jgi:hypothetical protein
MNHYGVNETNPVTLGYHDEEVVGFVDWADKRLAKIERLRLVSDPGFPFWDVSYCYGRLKTGGKVSVQVPFSGPAMLPKRALQKTILFWAKKEGVYAKGLGIFNAISTLN